VTCAALTGVSASANDPVLVGQPMSFHAAITPTNATQPLTFTWDFGAAGVGSDLGGPDPVFTYTEVGTFTVSVAATNCDGSGLVLDVFQVVVQDTCRPLTKVTANAGDPIELGQPMRFQSTIAPPDATRPIGYTWDFGAAGSGSDLDGPSPVFTYTEVGTHTVVVTATNCDGAGLDIGTLHVVVACTAIGDVDLHWGPQPVYVGATTTFTASVGGGTLALTYTWRFGDDGSQVIEQSGIVSHTFGLSGTFPVTLSVANPCSLAAPVVRQVSVALAPDGKYKVFLPLVLKGS
jgi:PKD repeat protein